MKRFLQRPNLEILEDRRLLATCHVSRLGDFGAGADLGGGHSRGDLRYCINKANDLPGHDTIDINATGTINLTGALPDLSTDMDIVGPGSSALTVRRNTGGNYRIFAVGVGAVVRISGLTASNGYLANGNGGGIYNNGTLTLIETRIVANQVHRVGSGHVGSLTVASGGGIYNLGSMLIEDSTVGGNSIYAGDYWGESYGGGIFTSGPLTIANSTTSGNSAAADDFNDNPYPFAFGGGIHIEDKTIAVSIDDSTIANNMLNGYLKGGSGISMFGSGTGVPSVTITHSTIASNVHGSGISAGGNLTLRNSIVANHGAYSDVAGAITSSGYNLIGKSAGGSGYVLATCSTSIPCSALLPTTADRRSRWPFSPAAQPSIPEPTKAPPNGTSAAPAFPAS
jgi:hypothetical protein